MDSLSGMFGGGRVGSAGLRLQMLRVETKHNSAIMYVTSRTRLGLALEKAMQSRTCGA
jgi:hypothetical protein